MEKKEVIINNGNYDCDIDISEQEWFEILKDKNITKDNYKRMLIRLLEQPDYKASCSDIAEKYDINAQSVNGTITAFCKAVHKKINRFDIKKYDGKDTYWLIAMRGKDMPDQHFERTLRPELVAALKRVHFSWIPFYEEFAQKLLTYKDNRKELLDIVYSLDEAFTKQLHYNENGLQFNDIDPYSVMAILNIGRTDENRRTIAEHFKSRMNIIEPLPEDFDGIPVLNAQKSFFFNKKTANEQIPILWNLFASEMSGDELSFCKYFDEIQKSTGIKWNITMGLYWSKPYEYMPLDSRSREYLIKNKINIITEKEITGEHYLGLCKNVKDTLKGQDFPTISYHAYLNSNEDRNYWLVGFHFGGTENQLDDFLNKGIWIGGWDNSKINQKQLKLVEEIKSGDVFILKTSYTKGSDHRTPALKIFAIGIVKQFNHEETNGVQVEKCFDVDYVNKNVKEFSGHQYGHSLNTLQKTTDKDIIDYVNSQISENAGIDDVNNANDPLLNKFIALLKVNHNLIFTGAPGTGKTFLAREIAEAMGAKEGSEQYAFVQFHPSYDYTDFVEGLRPTKPDANGNIGFERRDGVFKEFCKKAILANKIQKFKESISGTPIQINSINNSNTKITVELNSKNNISVPDKSGWCISDEKMLKYLMFNECHDNETYTKSIGEYITDNLSDILAQENKNFVFIIDEINRGEISKIFGELFFSIDPGYRGAKGTVMTQYQNLIDDGDVFKRGFFVPENVYIIGTMNDIDRSVESMDFAIRRRFTWQEVDVTDRVDKMGVNDEAKERMRRLNEKISEIEGLGKSYQIGGSYFKGNVDFNDLWELHLEGLLKEYLRGVPGHKEKLDALKTAYNGNDASKKEDNAKGNEEVANDAKVENNDQ